MKGHRRFWFLLLVTGVLFVQFASSTCSEDTDCTKPEEICCTRDFTCATRQKCHQSSCIIDRHCPVGKHCVNSQCKNNDSFGSKSCDWNRDCSNATSFTRYFKCCQGKCKFVLLCSTFTTTKTTTTTITTSGSSCSSWKDCANGEQCEEGKCKENSNVMLTKAGFLSAAILTGSIFLLILCCCFVRESRYSRQRYAERQRRRSRNRRRSRQNRRRSTHHNATAVENSAFSTEDSRDCEGGFFVPPPEYPRDDLTTPADNASPTGEQSSSPPPYYTLSFELPPSYEEALQTEENRSAVAEVA